MASGIFAILDDIAMLMDDTGLHASRELPVLWEITQDTILNKIIILPLVFYQVLHRLLGCWNGNRFDKQPNEKN